MTEKRRAEGEGGEGECIGVKRVNESVLRGLQRALCYRRGLTNGIVGIEALFCKWLFG